MKTKEQSELYDIKRTLERIKEYCENRSLSYDKTMKERKARSEKCD